MVDEGVGSGDERSAGDEEQAGAGQRYPGLTLRRPRILRRSSFRDMSTGSGTRCRSPSRSAAGPRVFVLGARG